MLRAVHLKMMDITFAWVADCNNTEEVHTVPIDITLHTTYTDVRTKKHIDDVFEKEKEKVSEFCFEMQRKRSGNILESRF